MTSAKTAKYSPTMLRALRSVCAPGASDREPEGVKGAYWTNTNTAVALLTRGALVNVAFNRQGITREGAEAIDVDYDAMIERAHDQALVDNANFRRCPLVDEGCDFTAFGRPATPYGHHREVTSDDQITYHLNQAHLSMGSALFIASITHLTDEHRANAAEFVEAYRKAKAYTDPDSLPDPDGTNELPVPNGPWFEKGQSATASQNRDYVEHGANVDYVVDIQVKGPQRCKRTELHGPHVWSWLGPGPTWYCCGTDADLKPQGDPGQSTAERPLSEIVVSETPSLFPGGAPVRTYADDSQSVGPYPPLPHLHGPVADDHGDPLATVKQILDRALGDVEHDTHRPVFLRSGLDDEWTSGTYSYVSQTTLSTT